MPAGDEGGVKYVLQDWQGSTRAIVGNKWIPGRCECGSGDTGIRRALKTVNDTWSERINLLYYNIFRFECFTQYIISYPLTQIATLTGLGAMLAKKRRQQDWDAYILEVLNDPKGGVSLHIAGIQITILTLLSLLSAWNVLCAALFLDFPTIWPYGGVVSLILAVVASFYAAPNAGKKYLSDFRKFEAMPKATKRSFALLTFLTVVGIWLLFISTFIFYLRSLPR